MPNSEYSFSHEDGVPIHHRFELERNGEQIVIVLKSGSGGTRSDGTPHNSQYNLGVERLFSVLSTMREPIRKVVLDTRVTRAMGLSEEETTLDIAYPILTWEHEPRRLRLDIGILAQNIGQEPGARGGNNQKQLRIYIRDINPGLNLDSIATLLSGLEIANSNRNRILPPGLPSNGETLFTRSNSPEGWVYIVTNPKWPKWVKIGVTRNISKRLSSYNTGAPTTQVFYKSEYEVYHENARAVEHYIHYKKMHDSPLRGDSKEWYKISIEDAKNLIDECCNQDLLE